MSDSHNTALFPIARVLKQTKILLVDHWVNTMWFRLTTECDYTSRKKGILPYLTIRMIQ
jgi:hypothetical protein